VEEFVVEDMVAQPTKVAASSPAANVDVSIGFIW